MKNYKEEIYLITVVIVICIIYLVAGGLFSGCAKKDNLKPTSAQTIVVEKKVVVGCEIPKIECDFKGELYEPTIKLLECVKKQKEAIRICTETKFE